MKKHFPLITILIMLISYFCCIPLTEASRCKYYGDDFRYMIIKKVDNLTICLDNTTAKSVTNQFFDENGITAKAQLILNAKLVYLDGDGKIQKYRTVECIREGDMNKKKLTEESIQIQGYEKSMINTEFFYHEFDIVDVNLIFNGIFLASFYSSNEPSPYLAKWGTPTPNEYGGVTYHDKNLSNVGNHPDKYSKVVLELIKIPNIDHTAIVCMVYDERNREKQRIYNYVIGEYGLIKETSQDQRPIKY